MVQSGGRNWATIASKRWTSVARNGRNDAPMTYDCKGEALRSS